MTDQDMADRHKSLRDRFDAFKDEVAHMFDEMRLGKDELLRVHAAIDTASAAATSGVVRQNHDLNDQLAENPEDHPREFQGDRPPIQTEDPGVSPVADGAKRDYVAATDQDIADAVDRAHDQGDEHHDAGQSAGEKRDASADGESHGVVASNDDEPPRAPLPG